MDDPRPDPIRAAREELAEAAVRKSKEGPPGEHPGDVIDRYKLLQEIGEGGMGSVWMAEQLQPVKRKVALKIIKLGMDTKQVVARFEAERQALALMDHPHIAKVLDGGATETGRPYFVMELVRGVSITDYCDQARLDLRSRLKLFAQVCGAIQHAHHKGIIHRDIKPSNVMVTLHDSVPVPKVIDFGIAKATSSELTQRTMFTQYAQVIGTPEYMAPEQAEMSGLDVDTRADVYSLGVLLYELLTGTKPFELTRILDKGYQELMRTIREDDPAKPSTRISTLGEKASPIASTRHASVKTLSKRLRGDLDWIVMKALEKDRARRYETANGFAVDVVRYLSNETVLAAPPSMFYKLRKLVRRRRKTVVAVAAFTVVLVAGAVGTGIGWWEAARANAAAEANAQIATQQRALALGTLHRVVTEVEQELRGRPGLHALRQNVLELALEGLDEVSRTIENAALADRSIGAAHQRLGEVLLRAGEIEEAEAQFRRGLEIFEELLRTNPDNDLARWNAALSLDGLGDASFRRLDDATNVVGHFRGALDHREYLAERGDRRNAKISSVMIGAALVNSSGRLADISLDLLRDPTAAEVHSRAALEFARGIHAAAPEHPLVRQALAGALRLHANCLFRLGHDDESGRLLDESLRLTEGLLDEFPESLHSRQQIARSMWLQGEVALSQGDAVGALDFYLDAHRYRQALLDEAPDSFELQEDLAASHHRVGTARMALAQTDHARRSFGESLTLWEVVAASDPSDLRKKLQLTLAQARSGQVDRAASAADRLRQTLYPNPGILVELASAYALCAGAAGEPAPGNADHRYEEYRRLALETLQKAMRRDFSDLRSLETHPDLACLRNDAEFRRLLQELSGD